MSLPNDQCLFCSGTAAHHTEGCGAAPYIESEEQLYERLRTSARLVVMNLRAELGIALMEKIGLAILVSLGVAAPLQMVEFQRLVDAGCYTFSKLKSNC